MKPSTDNSDEITPAQKAASFNLIRNIISRNPGIRKAWANSDGGITGHFSVSPITRERCPGPFPWDEMFEYLNEKDSGGNSAVGIRSDFVVLCGIGLAVLGGIYS